MKRHPAPILSPALQAQLEAALASFSRRLTWKAWGLDQLREQGTAILFWGPAGTGKTTTAYHVARRLKLRIREVSLASFGSHVPGQLARNISTIFMQEERGARSGIIFLDECDAVLISRKALGSEMVWMFEPINALLSAIGKYPGLVILATNFPQILDPALERRLLARIEFGRPAEPERFLIWKEKWPRQFPVQPTTEEFGRLARYDLTGAEIENRFLLWAGECLIDGQDPKVDDLINAL